MPTDDRKAAILPLRSMGIAFAIVAFWCVTLLGLLHSRILHGSWVWIGLAIGLRTLLQTGLFITAHDAMHGLIWPTDSRGNAQIGRLALWLYAFLPYAPCRQRHVQHHHFPTQREDPDFHADQRFWIWYWNFMRQYLNAQQGWQVVGAIALVLTSIILINPARLANLLLFWLLPLVLSSLQLFYFGVYLPHRRPHNGYADRHCASSLAVPIWLSFLMCYHFGYHWEHHEYPHLPWYALPMVARKRLRPIES
jgi:beta-carotene/zeaxanthin 4-ketolase